MSCHSLLQNFSYFLCHIKSQLLIVVACKALHDIIAPTAASSFWRFLLLFIHIWNHIVPWIVGPGAFALVVPFAWNALPQITNYLACSLTLLGSLLKCYIPCTFTFLWSVFSCWDENLEAGISFRLLLYHHT